MTRFEQEYRGTLGEFWKKRAHEEVERLEQDYENGKLLVEAGIARWASNNRVVPSDIAEKLTYSNVPIDIDATMQAREEEVAQSIAEYKKNYHGPSDEEMAEMRAAYGTGKVIVDILTGNEIRL